MKEEEILRIANYLRSNREFEYLHLCGKTAIGHVLDEALADGLKFNTRLKSLRISGYLYQSPDYLLFSRLGE